MEQKTFSFACGVTVTLQRVSPMFVGRVMEMARQAHIREHGDPERPTYTVKTAGGSGETWPHTSETIKEQPWADDDEHQAAWREYQSQSLKLQVATTRASLKAYCVRGVVDNPPDEWVEDQRYWKLEVADDLRDRKWDWINDIATGWDEILSLAAHVQSIPNPVEVAAQAARQSFQRAMEDQGGIEPGSDSGTDGPD